MYTSLNPGAIGIRANLEEGLELAQRHGLTRSTRTSSRLPS